MGKKISSSNLSGVEKLAKLLYAAIIATIVLACVAVTIRIIHLAILGDTMPLIIFSAAVLWHTVLISVYYTIKDVHI